MITKEEEKTSVSIENVLKKSMKSHLEAWKVDKSNPPEMVECSSCGKYMTWFWLNSDCPDIFPSRYMPNKCLCSYIREASTAINALLIEEKNIKNDGHELNNSKKHRLVSLGMELKKLTELNASNKYANLKYRKIRIEIAKSCDCWQDLFDCNNEEITLEMAQELDEDGFNSFLNAFYEEKAKELFKKERSVI